VTTPPAQVAVKVFNPAEITEAEIKAIGREAHLCVPVRAGGERLVHSRRRVGRTT
jgi:hypothetical protein